MIPAILFGVLFLGLIIGLPIAVAIGFATMAGFYYAGIDSVSYAQQMYSSIDSFTLLAIPFFMFAGSLMEDGGMSKRIVRLADAAFGNLTGGLAQVQVVASMFFAAMSGSSPATTAAIGTTLIPEMEKRGYPGEYAAAIQSVAGTIGTIIPPSIPMIIFGVSAGISVGKLFIAGILPGVVYGGMLMIMVYITSKKKKISNKSDKPKGELKAAFLDAIWALLVPVIILGGIYSGKFTATEAGAIACVYGLFACKIIYKDLDWKKFRTVLAKASLNTSMVLLIIAASTTFSWLMTIEGISKFIGIWFISVSGNQVIFFSLTVLLLLFLGCFIETIANILIVTPILYPVSQSLGIDPIHFGIVMIVTLSLGMATPPVGENLYIAASIAKVPFEKLLKDVIPFIMAAIFAVLLITIFPWISLLLPSLLF